MGLDSFINNARIVIKERISSPLLFSFIISWMIYNWRVWYVTFYPDAGFLEKFNSRIHYLNHYFEVNSYSVLIVWPLLTAGVVILGLPYINSYILKVRNHQKNFHIVIQNESPADQKELKKIKIEKANYELQTEGKILELISDHKREKDKIGVDLDGLEVRLKKLQAEKDILSLRLEENEKTNITSSNTIELLNYLERENIKKNSFFNKIESSRMSDFIADTPKGFYNYLKSLNVVEYKGPNGDFFSITDHGKKVLTLMGLD